MIYTNDNWVIIRLHEDDGDMSLRGFKVLTGFSGGYADGDSWRMNSGIKSFSDEGDHYLFNGLSGSVYKCMKGSEKVRNNIAGVIKSLNKTGQASWVDMRDFLDEFVEISDEKSQ